MDSLDRRLAGVLLLAIAAASVAICLWVVTPTISLDDPFIGLRYADHMLRGHGLVYNPGAYVEGYTAFLWILVGALGMWLGFEPLSFWQAGLILSTLVTIWLVYSLGRRPGRARIQALLAPALFGLHYSAVAYPMMGMESSFVTMLVTLAVWWIDGRRHESTRGALILGALLFTICLARFDGLVMVAILMAWVWVAERNVKRSLPALAVLGTGLAAYNGWRVWYYGDLLPNTFYAKTSTLMDQLRYGWQYLAHFAKYGGPFAILVVLLPLALLRPTRRMVLATWVVVGHLGYTFLVGGDWMPAYRFILLVLPLLCLLLQDSIWTLFEMAAATRLPARVRRAVLPGTVALVLAVNAVPLLRSRYVQVGGEKAWDGGYFSSVAAKQIGQHLSERLPPDCLVATEWAGIIPFYMRQPILDTFGLSDRAITRGDFPGGRMGKGITPEFLVSRDPEIVIFCGQLYQTLAEARIGVDCRVPHGNYIHSFYSALDSEKYGYETRIMKMPGGFWPFLIKRDSALRAELVYE